MPFGNQTISFVNRSPSGVPDELGETTLTEVVTNAEGCRHRPLTFTETAELEFDIATEAWKSTIPIGEYDPTLRSQVLSIKSNDIIRVDGQEYQIVGGIRPFNDFTRPFKATLISQKHIG